MNMYLISLYYIQKWNSIIAINLFFKNYNFITPWSFG